ncbi:DUF3533 domain-containing protein [Paenibacillus methanolicus]|uniref:YhgE/Pip-like protein n=1 Tax=Paenibacillus methanolicus TaxID=582686 RepID=A0A5S5CE21_9BACL|nr:DUF3533 domain-containing protein [Paenibacillus methanolicus]TYP76600.1 YhgE/Pip-like protein [Paenibacillus methanolicus]
MAFFKQKNILLAPVLVIVVALIFGLATLGSTVNPVPRQLPVLLAQMDEGSTLPGQGDVNYGKTIADNLTAASTGEQSASSPFEWEIVSDSEEGLDRLDRQEAYALVVIPQSLSADVAGLMKGSSDAADIQIYVNQGKNMSAAGAVSQAMTQVFQGINAKFSEQLTGALAAQGMQVNPAQIAGLANPVQAKIQLVHPVGTHSANGNAPGSLVQIGWMAALVASMLVFFAKRNVRTEGRKQQASLISMQVVAGAVLSIIAGFGILGSADYVFNMHVPSFLDSALFLSLAVFSFFLMMSALLSWLGFAGIPIFMLLFFFTGPVLTLAPEMLPQATRDLLYSWVPLRFAVEGLRDLFYFGQGLNIGEPLAVIASIAGGSLVVLLGSAFKPANAAKALPANTEAVRG